MRSSNHGSSIDEATCRPIALIRQFDSLRGTSANRLDRGPFRIDRRQGEGPRGGGLRFPIVLKPACLLHGTGQQTVTANRLHTYDMAFTLCPVREDGPAPPLSKEEERDAHQTPFAPKSHLASLSHVCSFPAKPPKRWHLSCASFLIPIQPPIVKPRENRVESSRVESRRCPLQWASSAD
ncbi:hypothetical protein LY76DRAFT_573325, partial [Colletotrichum caudatum]